MSEALTPSVDAAAAPVATGLTGGESAPAAAGADASTAAGGGEAGQAPAGQGATAEAPNGGDQAGGEPAAGPKGEETQGAPEAYAAFTVPDGYSLEGEWLDQVTGFAKAQNMTQEQAQALVDLGTKQAERLIADFTQQVSQNPVVAPDHWAKVWSDQTRADAEIGGEKLTDTMALATKVVSRFANDGLKELLSKTGLEHHPEMIRFMREVGKVISEDVLVLPTGSTSKPSQGPRTFEQKASKLYPNMATG